ncbi:MAG: hypothetical protein VKN33_10805 [Candidatus Sericytochromatia bacterium]|nr:hypothetical protein [Candidatus Sericytochromatia bacterium]
MPTSTSHRAEVLDVLTRLFNLRWRGLKMEDIPVQFLGKRIAVILPAKAFTADEQIKIEGKFQHLMAQRGWSAFIDFAENWEGAQTRLDGGFN